MNKTFTGKYTYYDSPVQLKKNNKLHGRLDKFELKCYLGSFEEMKSMDTTQSSILKALRFTDYIKKLKLDSKCSAKVCKCRHLTIDSRATDVLL